MPKLIFNFIVILFLTFLPSWFQPDETKIIKHFNSNNKTSDHAFFIEAQFDNALISQVNNTKLPQPWYRTSWLMLLMLIVAVVAIYLVIKIRIIHLKRLNRQLEHVVNARTSELVAQREQLQIANNDLRTVNKELDNFVYRSSHDLVAPLKSLKGLIHLAKIDNPDDIQLNYLQIMNSSVIRLEDFIKSILDYSINAKRKIEVQEVNLDQMINDIVSEIKYFEKTEKISLQKEYCKDFTLKSDPNRLKIILSNLIINSVKYHNYEQKQPYIKIYAAHKGDNPAIIKIEDNGQGIPKALLGKIFDMFFRASEKAEGSGLGLYIVKDIVAKLGAEISVESEVDKGTTFTIKIPEVVKL
ncbi:MAG: HAMP domain-containing sensor histidine kinase [Fulvivirga sp.]